jgi:RimJ/RimL family protein N-acetyltransferase
VTDWQALVRRYKTGYAADPKGHSIEARTRTGEAISLRPLQAISRLIPDQDVRLLCQWRNQNPRAFLTDLQATPESTRRYATEILGKAADRILFFVEDDHGRPFGHAGLDHIDPGRSYAELDNIVRGGDGPRGAMRAAVEALCEWAGREFGIEDFWVHVIADNPAVGFYEHLGFRQMKVVPLRPRESSGGMVRWVNEPGAAPESAPQLRQLLMMERRAA